MELMTKVEKAYRSQSETGNEGIINEGIIGKPERGE